MINFSKPANVDINDIRYRLFNAMKRDLCVMAEHSDNYMSLFKELKYADDGQLKIYAETFL